MGPVDIIDELPRHPTKVYARRKLSQIERIAIHTTDMDCSILDIANYDIGPNHISKTGCPAITYTYVVMPNGTYFKTLPFTEVGWHVGNHNENTVGIAMMFKVTDPKTKKDKFAPPDKLLSSAYVCAGRVALYLGIIPENIVGHRELFETGWFWKEGHKQLRKTCPGLQVNMDIFRQKVAEYMQLVLHLEGTYTGKVDGQFGPISKAALFEHAKQASGVIRS